MQLQPVLLIIWSCMNRKERRSYNYIASVLKAVLLTRLNMKDEHLGLLVDRMHQNLDSSKTMFFELSSPGTTAESLISTLIGTDAFLS